MPDLYFEGTTICLLNGRIDEVNAEAICIGANAEGLMASGHAGLIRLAAGPEVERELRAHAPLLVGEAYPTGPGKLVARGVRRIVHVVTNVDPGSPVLRAAVERGLDQGLELVTREGLRTLAFPDVGMRIPGIEISDAAALLAGALARRIRRGATLERVTITSLDDTYLRACRDALVAAGAGDA